MDWTRHWVSLLFGAYLTLTVVGLLVVMLFHFDRTGRLRKRLEGFLPAHGGWMLPLGLMLVYLSPVLIAILTIGFLRAR